MSQPKVALITGGASGIGRASAFRLAKRGYHVVVADLQVEVGTQVALDIIEASPSIRAVFTLLDVSSETSWKEAVAFTVATFGGITTLINNAGIAGKVYTIEEQPLDEWNLVNSINGSGPFLGMKTASDALHKAGSAASVVNVASMFAISGGLGNVPAYHASKGAVTALTRTTALAWGPAGIRVNAVLPGWVGTPLTLGALGKDAFDSFLGSIPLGRHATPDDIAKAIEFLATDDSIYMTGADLLIDGGIMLQHR